MARRRDTRSERRGHRRGKLTVSRTWIRDFAWESSKEGRGSTTQRQTRARRSPMDESGCTAERMSRHASVDASRGQARVLGRAETRGRRRTSPARLYRYSSALVRGLWRTRRTRPWTRAGVWGRAGRGADGARQSFWTPKTTACIMVRQCTRGC
jgi:hypothetical protein